MAKTPAQAARELVRADPSWRQPGRGLAVGLMTGTSADGVDAALVEIQEEPLSRWPKVRLVHFRYEPFSPWERQEILELFRPDAPLAKVAAWHARLGEKMAQAVLGLLAEAGVQPQDVEVIGSHGQTVAHYPHGAPVPGGPPVTVQIGDPARLAARTGIAVVSDFRARDVALGGQGAPLVPYFDRAVFSSPDETRVLLNVGGIANVTVLPKGMEGRVLAFDTGPGNMVLDGAVRLLTQGALSYDRDGQLAAQGRVHRLLLERWLSHPFFHTPIPRSTGHEDFGRSYVQERVREARELGLTDADILATLTELVAESIARGICLAVSEPFVLVAAGGGVHNRTLMARLSSRLPLLRPWEPSDAYGVPADAKEAMAFAYLAWQFLRGRTTNVPSATGAREEARLGSWTPPKSSPARSREEGPVRLGGPEDVPSAAQVLATQELWRGRSRDSLAKDLSSMLADGHRLFLAQDPSTSRVDGVLVASDGTFGNCGYVRILAVREGATGQGIGASLLHTAEDYFRTLGRKAVVLLCTSWNTQAQRFYEREGYRKVGSLPNWLEPGRDEWIYVRRLDEIPAEG